MKLRKLLFLIITSGCLLPSVLRAAPPRLVVNIVVGQMRYDYLARFSPYMNEGGFRKFMGEGAVFTDARYNFMQTITPATVATLTTGADPSVHGIVSDRWIDYTTGRPVELLEDNSVRGLDCDAGIGQYSYVHLTAPTLGDRLKEQNTNSKVVTIALDPVSAIVMGGFSSDVYWLDETRGSWISSTAYMPELPGWVTNYNSLRVATEYLDYKWTPAKHRTSYVNTAYSVFDLGNERRFRKVVSLDFLKKKDIPRDYPAILRTPAGNTLVAEFAKQAVVYEKLGSDEHTDILNICFDTPRYAGELFGGESMEIEDIFYRLDEDIADLVRFITAQTDPSQVVFILTSDHGASDSYDYGKMPRDRFNSSQFKVIVNGFMNTQYGPGDWVLDYRDRQLYLNRTLIYGNGLSLEEVQNRVAAFVLQFRGVSHVLTSTAMQSSYFSGSYAGMMQNSFYPRRSGDLMINLMPGWIEESEHVRAASGSMYEYDTHVPLMFLGRGMYGQRIDRTVNMKDVAPTLARIIGISRPIAAEGEPIRELSTIFE